MTLKKSLTSRRLKRSKPKPMIGITTNNKLNRAITKIADTIEEDYNGSVHLVIYQYQEI